MVISTVLLVVWVVSPVLSLYSVFRSVIRGVLARTLLMLLTLGVLVVVRLVRRKVAVPVSIDSIVSDLVVSRLVKVSWCLVGRWPLRPVCPSLVVFDCVVALLFTVSVTVSVWCNICSIAVVVGDGRLLLFACLTCLTSCMVLGCRVGSFVSFGAAD